MKSLYRFPKRWSALPHGVYTQVCVDISGLGQPVVGLMERRIDRGEVVPVYFNHGDRMTDESPDVTLGKGYLVTRLQMLLQTGQLLTFRWVLRANSLW